MENRSGVRMHSAMGSSQIALGVIAIVAATLAGRFTAVFIGIVLIIRGAIEIVNGIRTGRELHKLSGKTVVGALSAVLGVLLVIIPEVGAALFGLGLAVLFFVGGIRKIAEPFSTQVVTDKFSAMLGVISLLLGTVLVLMWPVESFGTIGVFAGLEIMLNGLTVSLIERGAGRLRREHGAALHR